MYAKFLKQDAEMKDVKCKMQNIVDLLQQRQLLLQQGIEATRPVPAISEEVRSRLTSSGSVKRPRTTMEDDDVDEVFKSCAETSFDNDSDEAPFEFPTSYAKKLARSARKSSPVRAQHQPLRLHLRDGRSVSGASRLGGNPPYQASRPHSPVGNRQPRRDTVWGKGQSNTASKFKGVTNKVPEAFLFMCDPATEVCHVKEHLLGKSINLTDVEKMPNENAR